MQWAFYCKVSTIAENYAVWKVWQAECSRRDEPYCYKTNSSVENKRQQQDHCRIFCSVCSRGESRPVPLLIPLWTEQKSTFWLPNKPRQPNFNLWFTGILISCENFDQQYFSDSRYLVLFRQPLSLWKILITISHRVDFWSAENGGYSYLRPPITLWWNYGLPPMICLPHRLRLDERSELVSRKIGKVEFWEQFEPYFIS